MGAALPVTPGSFRADIEGLRAIAVIAVVLYHIDLPGFAGGFVGVDVFFVLSGFLITGLLLRELERTGTIRLREFFSRRVRRLLPASALVLLATLGLSWWLLPPLQVVELRGDALATAGYVANIRFAVTGTDYLQAHVGASPFQHYWSLAVEEQFYVVWPLLLLLTAVIARRRRLDRRRAIGTVIAAVLVLSLAFGIWLTGYSQPWAFFSLPARAWELAAGGLLAVVAHRLPVPAPWTSRWLPAVGLAMLAAAIIGYGQVTFPGAAALLPVAATMLLLAIGQHGGPVQRGLGTAPMRWLGSRSYSLYLWHWPLLVLLDGVPGGSLAMPWRLALVAGSCVLADLTHRWVENPLRHHRVLVIRPLRSGAFGVAITGLAVGAVVLATAPAILLPPTAPVAGAADEEPDGGSEEGPGGASGSPSPGESGGETPAVESPDAEPPEGESPAGETPAGEVSAEEGSAAELPPVRVLPSEPESVPADLQPALVDARSALARSYDDGCHRSQTDDNAQPCVYGTPGAQVSIALVGDSHAAMWLPVVEDLVEDRGWELLYFTKSSCSMMGVPARDADRERVPESCQAWRAGVVRELAQRRADVVLLGAFGQGRQGEPGEVAPWLAALDQALVDVQATGATPILLGSGPSFPDDPATCLSANPGEVARCGGALGDRVDLTLRQGESRSVDAVDAIYLDTVGLVCDDQRCPVVAGNVLMYRDPDHLTPQLVRLLRPAVEAAVDGALAR